jgi:hypothetical protein
MGDAKAEAKKRREAIELKARAVAAVRSCKACKGGHCDCKKCAAKR